MLADIARFLLDILGSLLVALLLLRAWMRYIGMPSRNPVAMFTFAMTNWLVGPVSRALPTRGRIDWASILSALVVTLLLVLLMRAVVAWRSPGTSPCSLPSGNSSSGA